MSATGQLREIFANGFVKLDNFILFTGETHYAKGGAHDNIAMFKKLQTAIKEGELRESTEDDCDWWHVFDIKEGIIVAKSDCQAYGTDEYWEFG